MQRRKTSSRRSGGNCSNSGNRMVIVCIGANAAGSSATAAGAGGGGQNECLSFIHGSNLWAQREAIKTGLLNEAAAIFRSASRPCYPFSGDALRECSSVFGRQ